MYSGIQVHELLTDSDSRQWRISGLQLAMNFDPVHYRKQYVATRGDCDNLSDK